MALVESREYRTHSGSQMRHLYWLVAIPLLFFSVLFIAQFPLIPWLFLSVYMAYAVLLWFKPHAWLVALPAALPLLDLAPWTGWFLVDEFDAMVCITVAIGFLRAAFRKQEPISGLRFPFWGMVALLLSTYLISFLIGFFPLQPLDGNAWNGYYTHWNALRIGKGFVEGLLLAVLLSQIRAKEPQKTDLWLLRGLVLGLLVFGCVVLWERGVFYDLVNARNIYEALGGLLDFTSQYRATGLFSQMHLGGSAVDGYLVLCTIFPLVLLFKALSRSESVFGFMVLGLAMYAVLVTFTRGTYAMVGLSFIIYLGLLYLRARQQEATGLNLWFAYVGAGVALVLILGAGFHYGGSVTLFALSMAALMGGLFPLLKGNIKTSVRQIGLGLTLLAFLYLAVRGMVSSQYSDVGWIQALLLGMFGVCIMAGLNLALFRFMRRHFPNRVNTSALLVLVLVLPVFVVGLMNTRMEVRYAQIGKDLDTRTSHWSIGASLLSKDWVNTIFGMGLGGFPQSYLLGAMGDSSVGSIWYVQDDSENLLSLSGGTTRIGQRLTRSVVGPVQLDFKVRHQGGKDAGMVFRLCQRPLLVQDAWIPRCANSDRVPIEFLNKEWQTFSLTLDTKKLNEQVWYSPHFMLFSFGNSTSGTTVELAEVRLSNALGEPLLNNERFEAGADYWMRFNDFQHLPWHAKNLYLHIYLEQGLWGLLVFAVTMFVSLSAGVRQAMEGDLLAAGIVSAMTAFLMLGWVATLFDVPRLVTLFYLLALLPLIRQWKKPERKRRRPTRRMTRNVSS